MKRVNNKKNLYKSLVLLVILLIGIGYAYLTSNLSISGQTEVVANTWNIHFENLNVKEGSVTASTPATIQSNNVDITYTIKLSRPKEYYEFTVDVKNDGTLPGKVSISSLAGLDTTSSKIIDYSIKYKSGRNVNIGDILNAGSKDTIKVKVYYKDDISASDFPATDLNLTLTYTLQYVQSEEDAITTDNIIQDLITNNSSCFTKYTGQVTDEVGNTKTATKVYFDNCEDKRNIIFGGFCWQMIRTTETGGIKMLYNGEPVNGSCENTRTNHKGIVQRSYLNTSMNSNYLYGSSFTYDTSTKEFTLVDTSYAVWNDSTYQNLLGKFTCRSENNICQTIYQVNAYYSSTTAYLSYYTISNTSYSQIGKSSFNVNYKSPAMVGYMFNKVYNYKSKSPGTNQYKFGNTFTYDETTNSYTLSGTIKDVDDWSSSYYSLNNTHYTCWNTSGTCTTISYIYKFEYSDAFYIDINDGKGVNEALEEMLFDSSVNRYNSSIKGIIDAWYGQNLDDKADLLEDTIYCNARNMINQSTNGWNPDSGNSEISFKNWNYTKNLACPNETDQFALHNSKAKLKYPTALLMFEEYYNITNNSLMSGGNNYFTMSPFEFVGTNNYNTLILFVYSNGSYNNTNIHESNGIRPVISLKKEAVVLGGTGSETSPWIVD